MASKLSSDDVFTLSKSFHDMAVTVGNYRFDHWDQLTSAQRSRLESEQWTLLNTSSDLNAQSVLLKIQAMESELQTLQGAAAAMTSVANKLDSIKKALTVAASAVAFGASLYMAGSTMNLDAAIAAANNLVGAIQA